MRRNYTRGIILEDIALETHSDDVAMQEFGNMQQWWSTELKMEQSERVYSRIKNPLRFEIEGEEEERKNRYHEIMAGLFNHRLASRLSVNDNGRWIDVYKEDLRRIEKLAEVAAKDERKHNYFRIGFKERGTPWYESATIEFVEYMGEIIGNGVFVNMGIMHKHPNLFCIRAEKKDYNWNNALWMPVEDYMDLPRPFAKDNV